MATLDVERSFPSQAPAGERGGDRAMERWARWSHWELTAYLVLLAAALALRLWDLGAQAIHHDESLHAVYSWYITENRGYIHNPLMHGPFQFFGTALFYSVFGPSDATARLLSAVFGVTLVGLPVLLRSHLGRSGALLTSLLLAFSPTMLYFSRFARNDIFMAVWTLALAGFMWRYFDTRKVRYLVLSALALAFAYSTKETTFILIAVLGGYLLLRATDILPWLLGRRRIPTFSAEVEYLILIATLTLPLLAAAISIFQEPLGLTLANGDPSVAAVGIPIGTGLYVAFFVTVYYLVLSAVVGLLWRPRVWLACFGAFWVVWVSLHINVPAVPYDLLKGDIGLSELNLGGIGSGIWQSLGYWIQQHEVCRGCQPWYYYLVIGFNYEFLVMLLAVPAMAVYARRGDAFSRFLVYWAVVNFALYTFAGEKMPWLLVEVSLPFIVLAGKFLGELLQRGFFARVEEPKPIQVPEVPEEAADAGGRETAVVEAEGPKRQRMWMALGVVGMVALLLAVSGRMLSRFLEPDFAASGSSKWLPLLLLLLLAGAIVYLLSVTGRRRWVALVTLGLAAAMFALSVTGAFRLSYRNSDVPTEMLVYTQTAPEVPAILRDIERLGETTGKGKSLRITVDSTDGFSWPWAWYLREYPLVSYPCLSNDSGCSGLDGAPDADVVLLAYRNRAAASEYLDEYGEPVRYKHRWWFPESYRGLDPTTILSSIQERESWRRVVDYFLFRDFPEGRLGSIDGQAYFPKGFDTAALQ